MPGMMLGTGDASTNRTDVALLPSSKWLEKILLPPSVPSSVGTREKNDRKTAIAPAMAMATI